MTDGTPVDGPTRRLPTWREFLAAQTGWPFLIKWVLVGAAPSQLFEWGVAGVSVAGGTWNPSRIMVAAIFAASAAMQAWLIFRWSWRVLIWVTAASLMAWWGAGLGATPALLALPVIQVALLHRVRARLVWWLVAAVIAHLWEIVYLDAANSMARSLISFSELGRNYGYLALTQGSVVSVLLIQGATLAWLMPPVEVTAKRSSNP